MKDKRQVCRDLKHIWEHLAQAKNALTSKSLSITETHISLAEGILKKTIEREMQAAREND